MAVLRFERAVQQSDGTWFLADENVRYVYHPGGVTLEELVSKVHAWARRGERYRAYLYLWHVRDDYAPVCIAEGVDDAGAIEVETSEIFSLIDPSKVVAKDRYADSVV